MSLIAMAMASATIAASSAGTGDLQKRFSDLSCAVVRIEFNGGTGSGFIIDKEGHVATAAHVFYERHWYTAGTSLEVRPIPHQSVIIQFSDGRRIPIKIEPPSINDSVNANYDLAFAATGQKNNCYIPVSKSDSSIGQHVISIGYPNGNQTAVLYEGFVSAMHVHWPIPVGKVENVKDTAALSNYNVMRVQMPITPGASGSPIIDDRGEAIGIISEVPVIVALDVKQLSDLTRDPNGYSSGILLSGFDATKILGELASMVLDFQATGSAFAVPTYYSTLPH